MANNEDSKPHKKAMPKGKKRVAHVETSELKFGEVYQTTKDYTWSNYDDRLSKILVPTGETLIFRSFLPLDTGNNTELALFVWLSKRITVCLSVGKEASLFYVKHVEWDSRHEEVNQMVKA